MYFNLTQIPLYVEVGDHRFALDYHISIHFEIKRREFDRDVILNLTNDRLKTMIIDVEKILGEPIAVICFHGTKRWSGVIKFHLKNPETDGNGLLQGLRPFILKIDRFTHTRGKVCKYFHTIAIASMFSVKITTPSMKGKEWYDLFEEIVEDGFVVAFTLKSRMCKHRWMRSLLGLKHPLQRKPKGLKHTNFCFSMK